MDEGKNPQPTTGIDVDPEDLRRFIEWLNEPLDLGFPEGYRPAEF